MDSLKVENGEQIRYVNAQLVDGNDTDTTLQLESGEDEYNVNVAYTNDGQTMYVQQGQYIIPVGGHTVVLQDNQGDLEQYIINNIDDDLQDADQTEEEIGQPVIYYTGEFMEQSFEDGDDIPESTDESIVEESGLSAVIPLQKRIKLEQGYIDENQVDDGVEDGFVESNEENGCNEIIVAAGSDHGELQRPQYQYAILKNGKLHLQTLNISTNTTAVDSTSQFGDVEDGPQHLQLQEQLAAFQQSINMDDTSVADNDGTVDLEKITGKNLITGQTVTLDTYFDKLQRRLATVDVGEQCFTYKAKRKRNNSVVSDQRTARAGTEDNFINKKVVVGKTSNGKRIVGKILRVHRTGGEGGIDVAKECNDGDRRKTATNTVELPSIASTAAAAAASTSSTVHDNDDSESPPPVQWTSHEASFANEIQPQAQPQPHIIIKKHIVTRENFDYSIGKTLTGLMSLETVQRRLQNKNLMVKLVEKMYDHDIDAFNRTVSYVYGHMELVRFEKESPECRRWAFVLHSEKDGSGSAEGGDETTFSETDSSKRKAVCPRASPSLEGNDEKRTDDEPESSPSSHGSERNRDEDIEEEEESDGIKDVSLELEDWNQQNETASLTIVITVDKSGKKSTRVNLTPQQPDSRCHMCNKEFKTSLQMRKHLNNVHLCERSAKCELCDKTFANHTVLQRHRKIHTGERWYQCPKCPKSFNTAGSLKRHLTVHDPSLRPLECSVCVQRFTDESSLRKHLLIHTGIRAYSCEVCNRAFINQGDLNFHRRIHDPVKQFSCEVCGREFSRHSNLMRHAEIHRGMGALHRCDLCGCSYSFVSSLTRHIVQKHIGQQQQQQ